MSPRNRKPPVTLERRHDWLKRREEGESPPRIAAADGFDVRTVRKHVETALQERDTKEARAGVLRSALERHYADLCRYAERLGAHTVESHVFGLDSRAIPTVQYPQYLDEALRQHIPRSPIWNLLKQQTRLQASKAELTEELNKKIQEDVASDSHLLNNLTGAESGVAPGLIAALTAQSQQWARGYSGLNVESNLISVPAENGFVHLSYGAYQMGDVNSDHIGLVREAIVDWTARIKGSEVFKKLEKAFRDLDSVEANLRDEIAVIALRRVVPGRCRYCPV